MACGIFFYLQQQWQEQQKDPFFSFSESILGGAEKDEKTTILADSGSLWGSVGVPGPIQSLGLSQGSKNDNRQGRGGGEGAIGTITAPTGRGGSGPAGSTGSGRSGAVSGAPPVKRSGGGIQVGEHTGVLRMRGLPFSSSKEDIAKFFEKFNPVLDSIVLTYRSDGRATGEAYVGFESSEDSERAMALHRKMMGSRYIELFLSNKEEHSRALARFGNR